MKKNNLPDNWLVHNDGSQLFKDTVIKYLNDEFNVDLVGLNKYYGIVDSNLTNANYTNLECALSLKEFIELSKPVNMIDFKIKGTKLPTIPSGTEYRTCNCSDDYPSLKFNYSYDIFVSYGYTIHKNKVYILAERTTYKGSIYFMIKESDIIKLAEEQGMFKNNTMEKKIVGYKCPMDLFGGNVIKGTLYKQLLSNYDASYTAFSKKGYVLGSSFDMPKEIVETWEAVYELEEPFIEVNGYKAKFEEGKVSFGCASFHIDVFKGLNLLIEHIDNEKCPVGQNTSKNIETVTLGKGTFTRDQIKQIVEFYDAKFNK